MVQGPALKEPEVAPVEENTCRHHWIIESPHGATSWGQCKVCGARKEFPNSAGDALWERDGVGSGGRWGSAGPVEVTAGHADSNPRRSFALGFGDREEDEGY